MEPISREFQADLPWELLYADDMVVIADSKEEVIRKFNAWMEVLSLGLHDICIGPAMMLSMLINEDSI